MRRMGIVVILSVLLVALAATAHAGDPPLDLLIVNGRVVDGTGAPWFRADVGVRDGRIVAVGALGRVAAKRRIDARDAMVAPGFIDLLGQSEWEVLVDNRVESKIRQGITTEITAEGSSPAPLNEVLLKDLRPWLARFRLQVDWTDLPGYFRRLRAARPTINMGVFVGAAQVRGYVLGLDNVQPTPAQLARMEAEVARAMEAGALGVSSSLIYPPGSYARTPELIALARVAARYGGLYATHLRDEGETIMPALEEAFVIARAARIPVEIWHLKAAGKASWGRMPEILARIERARAEGLDVSANVYPYTALFNGLDANLPDWASAGGVDPLLGRLRDPAQRARIKREMRLAGQYRQAGDPANILIAHCSDPGLRKYVGKRLPEVARMMGTTPEDALMDLVIADRGETGNVVFLMSDGDLEAALRTTWVAFDTDFPGRATDGPFAREGAHPRAFGSAARMVGYYARDRKLFSVEEAVRKMTSLPARRVGLTDRGLVRPGMAADLVIFDPARVRDRATYDNPRQYPDGIGTVIVNGQVVLDSGRLTAARPGHVLARGR